MAGRVIHAAAPPTATAVAGGIHDGIKHPSPLGPTHAAVAATVIIIVIVIIGDGGVHGVYYTLAS